MRPGRGKDLVAAASLGGALVLGAFLLLRSQGAFGVSWTDGQRRYDSETGAGVRHAVWDPPEILAGLGEAADPTLSPDGRFLVFVSGTRGLNSELWVAELVDSRPANPHPLTGLNSPSDELAPAFGAGGLLFASDRPGGAGRLDLWFAPYSQGEFGRATAFAPGLNSAADETDPAPVPGTRSLVFASDRARADLDLYAATPDASGFFVPEALDALNSPQEEREPTFSGDPRSLLFASDRAGGAGAFDLYRALCFDGGWSAPTPLCELNTAHSERGPGLAVDGFTLWYARSDGDGASRLLRAPSRELFRLPQLPVTLAQWLVLAGLLALALLALLAKRWRALDILYKCILVSLLLHLLLMLYLRTVAPAEQHYETGTEEGPTFRVLLAPPEPDGDTRALTGPSAPAREHFAPVPSRAEAPATAELPVPEEPARDAPRPESRSAPLTAGVPAPQLAQPQESNERYQAAAPTLVLEAHSRPTLAPESRTFDPLPAARRADPLESVNPGTTPSMTPSAASLAALTPASHELARGRQRPALPAPVSGPAPDPTLAVPRESMGQAKPETSPVSPPFDPLRGLVAAHAARSARPHDGPERAANPAPLVEERAGSPTPAPLANLVRADALPAPPPFEGPRVGSAPASTTTPNLRAAESEAKPYLAPSTPFDVTAGLDLVRTPSRPAAAALERAGVADSPPRTWPRPEPQRPEPARITAGEPNPGHALGLRAGALDQALDRALQESPRPRLAETPYQNRFGEQKLRALEEFGGTRETEHAVAAGLAYLARIQGPGGEWGEASDAHAKYLDVRIGKSALALLAFLGAGHVPGAGSEHAAVAEKAVRYLLASQDPGTGHFGRSCSYGHGIATYALAECYAMTRDARLSGPLERAIAEILRHQNDASDPRLFGGWGYYFQDGHVWNRDAWPRTSVTAWQVMALESARLGGLGVPDRAFADAREFLLATWDPGARAFRYDHDPARLSSGYPILPASTPAALFALALLGVNPAADELAQARRFVLTRAPDGYRYTGDDDFVRRARGNLYFWYYATLAMFRVGGNEWERWNSALKSTLLPAQEADGSWRPLDVYAEYAGDEDDERTYTTAMCVLSLEVYYRYFTPLLEVR